MKRSKNGDRHRAFLGVLEGRGYWGTRLAPSAADIAHTFHPAATGTGSPPHRCTVILPPIDLLLMLLYVSEHNACMRCVLLVLVQAKLIVRYWYK
jgi:hypothetical protein